MAAGAVVNTDDLVISANAQHALYVGPAETFGLILLGSCDQYVLAGVPQGSQAGALTMQTDDLVLYADGKSAWQSNTRGTDNVFMMTTTGELQVKDAAGRVLWRMNTVRRDSDGSIRVPGQPGPAERGQPRPPQRAEQPASLPPLEHPHQPLTRFHPGQSAPSEPAAGSLDSSETQRRAGGPV